jgi:hypothetical protein
VFIVWWTLAWYALDTVRLAALGARRLNNSELVLGAGNLGWFFVTWALFFFKEALEVLSNTSEHAAGPLEV